MPAKIDLSFRRKPPEFERTFFFNAEGGFGKIVPGGYLKKPLIVRPLFKETNCGRVPPGQGTGKSIDLKERDFDFLFPLLFIVCCRSICNSLHHYHGLQRCIRDRPVY